MCRLRAIFLYLAVIICAGNLALDKTSKATAGTILQINNATKERQIQASVHAAGFKTFDGSGLTYLEVYISIPIFQFSTIKKGDKEYAFYELNVALKDSGNNEITERTLQSLFEIDSESSGIQKTIELVPFSVSPSSYELDVNINDLINQSKGFEKLKIIVPHFNDNKLTLSDIQIASRIELGGENKKFIKNNIFVQPHPSCYFTNYQPFLYFYSEIYCPHQEEKSINLIKQYQVFDKNGNSVLEFSKAFESKQMTNVFVGKVRILTFTTGMYTLEVSVSDTQTGETTQKRQEFWVENVNKPSLPDTSRLTVAYTEEQIQEMRNQIFYLCAKEEIELFDELNMQAKVDFIQRFWRSRSPRFQREYISRYYFANEKFSTVNQQGWKTDRGRIYLMYGAPSEIEQYPESISTKPYEVWTYYNIENQGQVIFVFADLMQFRNYELIHSTLQTDTRSEIYDPNWIERIRIGR